MEHNMVEDLINLEILKFYDSKYKKDPYHKFGCFDFTEQFGITNEELLGHIIYLNAIGLLECKTLPDDAVCKISAKGIDALRYPDKYESDRPVYNIVIHGDVTNSPILQGQNIKIINSFNRIYDKIEDSDLDSETKKEIHDNVTEINNELKKESPRLDKIKSNLNNIKKKFSKILPQLTPLIIDCIRKYLDINS